MTPFSHNPSNLLSSHDDSPPFTVRRRAAAPSLLARAPLGGRMAERSDPPSAGGGTARPGAAISGQPKQEKKKPKYPEGSPVVEINGAFDITEPSCHPRRDRVSKNFARQSGATVFRRTGMMRTRACSCPLTQRPPFGWRRTRLGGAAWCGVLLTVGAVGEKATTTAKVPSPRWRALRIAAAAAGVGGAEERRRQRREGDGHHTPHTTARLAARACTRPRAAGA